MHECCWCGGSVVGKMWVRTFASEFSPQRHGAHDTLTACRRLAHATSTALRAARYRRRPPRLFLRCSERASPMLVFAFLPSFPAEWRTNSRYKPRLPIRWTPLLLLQAACRSLPLDPFVPFNSHRLLLPDTTTATVGLSVTCMKQLKQRNHDTKKKAYLPFSVRRISSNRRLG
jgi:hypothetical protein